MLDQGCHRFDFISQRTGTGQYTSVKMLSSVVIIFYTDRDKFHLTADWLTAFIH